MQRWKPEQRAAAEALVASRLRAKGVPICGQIVAKGLVYENGTMAITYLHAGRQCVHVVRGIPPEAA
jgi:hypothetical protein